MATLNWTLHRIDESTRPDHHWLTDQDDCFYFHDYTPTAGYAHSPANNFVYNFKIKVRHRNTPRYNYKTSAIGVAGIHWRRVLAQSPLAEMTFVPIPPSKIMGHPEYDDRVTQTVRLAAAGTDAELKELIVQTESYDAAHEQGAGGRIRPEQLQQLYTLANVAPRQTVVLFDDVLTTGCHFVAAKRAIQATYPDRQVIGMFLARVARPQVDPGIFFNFE